MPSGFLGGGVGPRPLARQTLPNPVPVAGAELLTNGDFSAWTGDNPNGWTVSAEVGSDPMVTQVAGGARMYSSATGSTFTLNQAFGAETDWIQQTIILPTVVSGSLSARTRLSGITHFNATIAGTYLNCFRMLSDPGILFIRAALPLDATIGSVAAKKLTLSSLLSTRAYASADCDLSAAVTRTAGTQAGLVARLDSATSPANFIIAYLDGAGNVKCDKVVAGTYTNVISGAVTYVAGATLRLVCNGNSVSAYYNGTQVGTTQTVSDAGIVSNVRHGKFSTYASNVLASYVAA